ncbi:DUF4962 domain-containing protein [Coraliomargarita sp. SDUM461004]|uniref:DUF4962 domain-containing protein n=1 Tax=Thalassobacterium sedimentorum TaxID=3041258 RepID=A0ABU1AJ77_9BACT|nr:DUF4962 domain-containing protein [Coraliomargarita sp. SDUM461004]MDQ8194689.1 DUF4962 domain-containing protein [Coraliomargarita sp. SDUM461004]
MSALIKLIILAVCFFIETAIGATVSAGPFIPFNSTWDSPRYLGFRPAHGFEVDVNPPRFSWPYTPIMVGERGERFLKQEFTLQIAREPSFVSPEIEQTYAFNFGNALPAIDNGKWYWRVGYAPLGASPVQWSAVREFYVPDHAVVDDRSWLTEASKALSKKPHPRLAPGDGRWDGLLERLMSNTITASVLTRMQDEANQALQTEWWHDFPQTDRATKGKGRQLARKFMQIGDALIQIAFIHHVTGDDRYAGALERALTVAAYPQRGETTPEYNGASDKWGTRWVFYLAYIYDWYYHEMTPNQRSEMLSAIEWRLQAIMGNAASWEDERSVHSQGVAGFLQSHPLENFYSAAAAIALTVGDSSVADHYAPLMLNYLLGVGSGYGPEEAWNEAGAYAISKSEHPIRVALICDVLLEDYSFSELPWFQKMGRFLMHLLPPGMERQGFGDYTLDMNNHQKRADLRRNLMMLGLLSQDQSYFDLTAQIESEGVAPRNLDGPVFCIAADVLGIPTTRKEPVQASRIFPVAGWLFSGSHPVDQRATAWNDLRMTMLARPKGGYSHSYPHEGAFVLQYGGESLAAGGGATVYADPYSRNSLSHNSVLVDGKGQAFQGFNKSYPYAARPLYWDVREGVTIGAIDGTGGFLVPPKEAKEDYGYLSPLPDDWGNLKLKQWIRSFVLVDERFFAVYDTFESRADMDPARFSFLLNIPTLSEVREDPESGILAAYDMGTVRTTVFQDTSEPVTVFKDVGESIFVNPITGTNYKPMLVEAFERRNRNLGEQDYTMTRLCVTTEATRTAHMLTVFSVNNDPSNVRQAEVDFEGDGVFTLRDAVGEITVSFTDEASEADIAVPQNLIREHSRQTEPYRLLSRNQDDTIQVGDMTMPVTWILHEDFQSPSWMNRWMVESENSPVFADTEGLRVSLGADPETAGGTTVWLRPQLPEDCLIRIIAKVNESDSANAANLNVFMNAREADGSALIFGRSGDYAAYHSILNYTMTLTGGAKPGWSRLRKNPGFNLVSEADTRSEVGQTYELILIRIADRIQVWLDGHLLHDWTDENPLSDGNFGLRTWRSDVTFESVEIAIPSHER